MVLYYVFMLSLLVLIFVYNGVTQKLLHTFTNYLESMELLLSRHH